MKIFGSSETNVVPVAAEDAQYIEYARAIKAIVDSLAENDPVEYDRLLEEGTRSIAAQMAVNRESELHNPTTDTNSIDSLETEDELSVLTRTNESSKWQKRFALGTLACAAGVAAEIIGGCSEQVCGFTGFADIWIGAIWAASYLVPPYEY